MSDLALRLRREPEVVRAELLAFVAEAPPDEVKNTRDLLVDIAGYMRRYDTTARAEALRLARLTEWEMARRWPVNAVGVGRSDDRPVLGATNTANVVAWNAVYAVGRADRAWLLEETEPSALTQQAVIKRVNVAAIGDVAPIRTDRKFGVIYADPPWAYTNKAERGTPENHYPVMTIDDICALEVPAADDCILYLWATAPLLPEALRVINEWGFAYKSGAVWDKDKIGVGYWFRGQHEHLLVGVRGRVVPPPQELRVSSVYREPRRGHSRKPDHIRRLIASWYPDVPRLEMFCRHPAPGWTAWGNQVGYDDTLTGLPAATWEPPPTHPGQTMLEHA